MAALEYHSNPRGTPGFTVPIATPTGTSANVRPVVPAYVQVASDGTERAAGSATDPVTATGLTVVAGGSFTRPADTTPYASGDLVANSVTATAVVPVSVAAARKNGGSGAITGVRLSKSSIGITNAQFRVHFFKGLAVADGNGHFVTVANGDNGAFSPNVIGALHIGYCDVTMDISGTDGAKGEAAPARAVLLWDADASRSVIYALVEARAAYTPTSGETFTVAAEISQD